MKARVKATGEIGIVANIALLFGNKGYRYQSDEVEIIDSYAEVDADNDTEIDYWTRLEHQYAGMAMQGIVMNEQMQRDLYKAFGKDESMDVTISEFAIDIANTLIQKLKEKEERK